jgi:hypothetical protein
MRYADIPGAQSKLIDLAQRRWENALEWTEALTRRYREEKLNLEVRQQAREVNFVPWKPGGGSSIYDFFTKFEEWSAGHLSEKEKAYQLFNRHLDKSLVDTYEELVERKTSYSSMKSWLVGKWGSVRPMVESYLRAIQKLPQPKDESDLAGQANLMRAIHKHLNCLMNLEMSKGVPVPKLDDHLKSNTFLVQLYEVLPSEARKKFTEELVEDDLDIANVEGKQYLRLIIKILRKLFLSLESQAQFPCKVVVNKNNNKPKIQAAVANSSPAASQPPKAASPAPANPSPPNPPTNNQKPDKKGKQTFATGANLTPLGNRQSNHVDRWACPIKGHENHQIQTCPRFFNSPPGIRRRMLYKSACYTCLGRGEECNWGTCGRIQEVPADLVCKDCAKTVQAEKSPPTYLLCGLNGHDKPDEPTLTAAVEAWIPNLSLASLGVPLRVNITSVICNRSAINCSPNSKSSPPSCKPLDKSFDPSTGKVNTLLKQDYPKIIKQSQEHAFYIMQTLAIGGEEVLTFYDSGSNGNLIEGALAEDLNFDVLDSRCVPVGVLGGGHCLDLLWSLLMCLGTRCGGKFPSNGDAGN